ncbi:MAG: hypothetical protein MI748_17720 [Opitutales bacterium]|nr:hypothetical protein [Opitutales bacterium]
MKKTLRTLAVIIPILGISVWIAQGPNLGWTKTQIEVQKVDDITGIEYSEYEDRITFGVELPVLSLGLSALLFGGSFLLKKKS